MVLMNELSDKSRLIIEEEFRIRCKSQGITFPSYDYKEAQAHYFAGCTRTLNMFGHSAPKKWLKCIINNENIL
jgi:hypothetical protein